MPKRETGSETGAVRRAKGYDGMMSSNEILVALRRIMRAIDLRSKALEKQVGLTVPQLLVLQVLNEADRLNVSEIANAVNLSQGTATSIVQRLVAKGLVSKQGSSSDRRMVMVALTARGKSKLAASPELFQEKFTERFEQLDSWEQKMLISAVERIAAIMNAEDVPAAPILQVGEFTAPAEPTLEALPPKR